jgi:hypothetical protein
MGAKDTGVQMADAITERTRPHRAGALLGGGTAGNEQLTATVGALLLVLLAVLGVTIIRIGQLLWLHLFLGLLLIGPVALKMGSTGYRFVRYYTADPPYRRKGPPATELRLLAPLVVASTIAVFATGVLLLLEGPGATTGLVIFHKPSLLFWHKVTFFIWLGVTGLHVLGHLVGLPRSMRAVRETRSGLPGLEPGAGGRMLAFWGAIAIGALIAVALLPDFGTWTSAHFHHFHHLHHVGDG